MAENEAVQNLWSLIGPFPTPARVWGANRDNPLSPIDTNGPFIAPIDLYRSSFCMSTCLHSTRRPWITRVKKKMQSSNQDIRSGKELAQCSVQDSPTEQFGRRITRASDSKKPALGLVWVYHDVGSRKIQQTVCSERSVLSTVWGQNLGVYPATRP